MTPMTRSCDDKRHAAIGDELAHRIDAHLAHLSAKFPLINTGWRVRMMSSER